MILTDSGYTIARLIFEVALMGFDENDSFYEDKTEYDQRREPTPMGSRRTRRTSGLRSFLLGVLTLGLLLAATAGVTNLVMQSGWLPETLRTRIERPAQQEQAQENPVRMESAPVSETPISMPEAPLAAEPGQRMQLEIAPSPTGVENVPSDVPGALSLQEIYRKAIPSVVSIATNTSSGTGILMSEDGYVITNHHVISKASTITVMTSDDRLLEAQMVGSDETSDLAVLKVEGSFIPAEFGDSDQLRVGDIVVAIGDPLGVTLRGTMTNGIISAINRDLTVDDRTMTLIQTNAALNNGNSGGPLINCYGQVIGVNTIKMGGVYSSSSTTVEGLGFAIPMAVAKPIIDELIEKGFVSGRPAIGIVSDTLPDTFRIYYRLPKGVYVSAVTEGSDAEAKGLATGDIITAINGVKVTNNEELNTVKNRFSAGDTVRLTVYRGGQYYEVDIELIDKADVK